MGVYFGVGVSVGVYFGVGVGVGVYFGVSVSVGVGVSVNDNISQRSSRSALRAAILTSRRDRQ